MDAIARKKQRTDLIVGLGYLLRPLREIAVEGKTTLEIAQACRQFDADLADYKGMARAFASDYRIEHQRILEPLGRLKADLSILRDSPVPLTGRLDEVKDSVSAALYLVPLDVPSLVIGPLSPFRAYATLKTLFSAARTRVWCADPYMDHTIFHRYLADVEPSAEVLLVTTDKGGGAKRLREVVDVARLYANDRAPTAFTLVQATSGHDRFLICDSEAHHLGGSLKDAAAKDHYSITPHDLADAESTIQDLVNHGQALLGQATRQTP